MRIVWYAVLSGIAVLTMPGFNVLFYAAIWIWLIRYASVVLARTAAGRFDEPDGVDSNEYSSLGQVFKQVALIAIACFFGAVIDEGFFDLDLGLGWLIAGLLAPAGIMIIAVQWSFWQALNPRHIAHFIKTIGSPYLALSFALFSLIECADWILGFLSGQVGVVFLVPVLSAVAFYFVIVAFHMMGYVVYQYHDELGLRAAVGYDQAAAALSRSKAANPALTPLNSLVADGNFQAAIDLLETELRKNWEDNEVHDRYHRLLVAADRQSLAMHHAREYIHKLVNERRLFKAMDLFEQCLKIDPGFKPHDPFQVHTLAAAADTANRQQLALDMMRDFDKHYPDHPHIPSMYLLTARILSERFHKNREAMQILHSLRSKYPDHELSKAAEKHMETLTRLMAS